LKSLHLRIMLTFSLIILISASLLSYRMYTSSVELITQSIGEQARSIAEHTAKQLDLDKYRTITVEAGETANYKELRLKLNELREANQLKYLYTMGERTKGDTKEYYYLVDGMPLEAKGEDISQLGMVETVDTEPIEKAFQEKQAQVGNLTEEEPYGAILTAIVPIMTPTGEMIGVLGADFDATNIYALLQANQRNLLWTVGGILLVSLAIIYGFSRWIVAPVLRLTEGMQRVQAGDLTVEVPVKGQDEIARMTAAFQNMVRVLKDMIQEIERSVKEMKRTAELNGTSATSTSQAGASIALHLQEAAAGAETQARCSEDTAMTTGEVSAGVQRIADSLGLVTDATKEAKEAAGAGEGHMQQALKQMESIHVSSQAMAQDIEQLAEQSDRVSQIVDVIKGISNQTNLLALNAAIEAARAGEHGKGFAVVAEQVRKLAIQSEESAAQISELIESILHRTAKVVDGIHVETKEIDKGLAVVRHTGSSFHQIVLEIEKVAEQVEEVSAVSEELAAGAEEVMASMEEMDRLTQRSSESFRGIAEASETQLAALQQMAASTGQLTEMSGRLEQLIKQFKL
jgi:methyl-accepting chemotaxis protein